MEPNIVSSVCNQVYRKFPELNGVKPELKPQGNDLTLFIFHINVKTDQGFNIPRTVRAVADPKGKIKKITTSR